MEHPIYVLSSCPLFQGLTEEEISRALECLPGRTARYPRGGMLSPAEDAAGSVGIVLEGRVHIVTEDFWGNQGILGEAGPGQVFGESLACFPQAAAGIHVLAVEDSLLLFLPLDRLLSPCGSACPFHARIIRNLAAVLAEKNLLLTRKAEHMSQRSLRKKLLSYLSWQAKLHGSPCFSIPFNRQQLADYLAVDRSALSAELSRMRREKLLDFQKQWFCLGPEEEGESHAKNFSRLQ